MRLANQFVRARSSRFMIVFAAGVVHVWTFGQANGVGGKTNSEKIVINQDQDNSQTDNTPSISSASPDLQSRHKIQKERS